MNRAWIIAAIIAIAIIACGGHVPRNLFCEGGSDGWSCPADAGPDVNTGGAGGK